MASVSSTSSLGNTSLRGFGGMASGIDRDAIIEKMTLGTTTKINNRKKEVTKLQWKQEAYRNLSDKIIDISDKYASYSSTSNLKDPMAFAKNVITVMGREEATRFVSATGNSKLIDNVSIKEVSQLATSTVRQSRAHISTDGLLTTINDLGKKTVTSELRGRELVFGKLENLTEGGQRWTTAFKFEFKDSYTVKNTDGTTESVSINYNNLDSSTEIEKLNRVLNDSVEYGDKFQNLEFSVDDGKIGIGIKTSKTFDYEIHGSSSALTALGFDKTVEGASGNDGRTVTIDQFNEGVKKSYQDAAIRTETTLQQLTGKKVTFDYNGSRKEIELITKEEAENLSKIADKDSQLKQMAENLQKRLDKAFGTGAVTIKGYVGDDEGTVRADAGLRFKVNDNNSSVSIISGDDTLLKNMGIGYGESNKINLSGKLNQSALYSALDTVTNDGKTSVNFSGYKQSDSDNLDLEINGVKIQGITENSSIEDILSKINSTTDAGVKATYVDATGQFMLVSSETGKGREISLDSKLAQDLFGGQKKADGSYDKDAGVVEGQNAKIKVSYGNGVDVELERSSNSFNLEGLNVTVSGIFGGDWVEETYKETEQQQKKDENGKPVYDTDNNPIMEDVEVEKKRTIWKPDSSETVTFSAKADVDGVVEKVKGFFEEFNALVADISGQVRTRPDSSYEPLTDEQKDELDETSIENWENKAKQGILYGDSIIRDLSADVEGIFAKLLNNGASYEDLKAMGITYSEDWNDGGTLVFDEAAFRSAMETDPDKVANIFTGGGDVKKGLINIVEDTFTPYATRYASRNSNGNPGSGSYGRLIEMAGSEKKPTTLFKNEIYKQIEEMNKLIDSLQDQLKVEQDRYISQFTTMESLLNQFNSQASYLSQLTA